jgi:hypothetical protein
MTSAAIAAATIEGLKKGSLSGAFVLLAATSDRYQLVQRVAAQTPLQH